MQKDKVGIRYKLFVLIEVYIDYLASDNFFKHQLTARYTPKQNGMAERKNQIIMDMVYCILQAKHMLKKFWAEAIAYAVYLLNRCPTKCLEFKTPYKVWSGRTPSIKYLHVIGCIAYTHMLNELRKKLDDKSKKCIFIYYNIMNKANDCIILS